MTEFNELLQQTMVQNGLVNVQIDNDTYTIKLLPATHAYTVAESLIEFLAPVIGCIYDSNDQDEFEDSSFGTNLGLIISKQIKELNLVSLSRILLQGTTKNGQLLNLDRDLIGAKGLVILAELTEVALKENVFDFLSEWLGKKGLKIPSWEELQALQGQTS